jgi:hypothetical protein
MEESRERRDYQKFTQIPIFFQEMNDNLKAGSIKVWFI